jgi:hypothetical protein
MASRHCPLSTVATGLSLFRNPELAQTSVQVCLSLLPEKGVAQDCGPCFR